MKTIIIYLFCFINFLTYSQKIDKSIFLKMLKDVALNYAKPSYEMSLEQVIYSDSSRMNIQSQNKTKMIKNSNTSYQVESRNMLVVNGQGIKLVIDSINNEIFLFKEDTMNIALWSFEEPQFEHSTFFFYSKGKEKIYRAYINHPDSEILYVEYKLTGNDLREMNLQYKPDNYMDLEYEEVATIESPFIRTVFEQPTYNLNKSGVIPIESIVKIGTSGKYELIDSESPFSLHDLRYQEN